MSDDLVPSPSRPPQKRTRWGLRVVGIVVVGLVVWSLFDSAISTAVRAVIALAGYLVVGFVAYSIGKWVGRRRAVRNS